MLRQLFQPIVGSTFSPEPGEQLKKKQLFLSVTLPAGRDTETVRTPGNTPNIITSQPACSSNHTLPHVSTPASVGGRRFVLCRTVFLIAGISRQTITLAIAHPAGGDTVAILTAEPAMGTTGQLRGKNSQQNKVSELLTLAGSLQSRHSHQDSPVFHHRQTQQRCTASPQHWSSGRLLNHSNIWRVIENINLPWRTQKYQW